MSSEDISQAEKGNHHSHGAPHDLLDAVLAGTVDMTTGQLSWTQELEQRLGIEERGLERVPEENRARQDTLGDYAHMCSIWFSANVTLNNLALGLLGPTVYHPGLTDSMCLGVFGATFGSAFAAYIPTFGPLSGCRTLVSEERRHILGHGILTDRVTARYTMVWWPSKICAALNIVIMLGYGLVDCLLAGKTLSAVANSKMSVVVGTIIAAVITLIIAVFGIKSSTFTSATPSYHK